MMEALECQSITKIYTSGLIRKKMIFGAKNVSFRIRRSEIVGLVGESGSGKTTVARMILRLIEPTSGDILLDGESIFSYDMHDYYRRVQGVFQDPYSACNPFYRIDRILHKALNLVSNNLSSAEKNDLIRSTLKAVMLNPDEVLGRFPHQLSGGQMQRILVARALLVGSELLLADEPTSMIDASTRAGILNLLLDLKENRGLSILFITHDIGQAQYLSDRILVMNKGEVVEEGATDEIFSRPKHSYTKKLLASAPRLYEKWEWEPEEV